MDTRDFLVPDNYADFHCKCGQCRHTCCDGWAVTFPREDYFRLLSVPCSPELRCKLDTSLHLADDPTPERYAELLPNWEGHCPLQRADGLCALQAECGEEAISSTCRYYPRGIRTMDDDECACSASCERVVEMLLHRLPPMTFRRMRLSFAMALPPRDGRGADGENAAIAPGCRHHAASAGSSACKPHDGDSRGARAGGIRASNE